MINLEPMAEGWFEDNELIKIFHFDQNRIVLQRTTHALSAETPLQQLFLQYLIKLGSCSTSSIVWTKTLIWTRSHSHSLLVIKNCNISLEFLLWKCCKMVMSHKLLNVRVGGFMNNSVLLKQKYISSYLNFLLDSHELFWDTCWICPNSFTILILITFTATRSCEVWN